MPRNLEKSDVVTVMPIVCSSEDAAVEFFEWQRWGDTPKCAHCEGDKVDKMTDATGEKRSARYLWRCRACGKQYTVRVGTVYEESRLPLRHWCYAFWRASTSKKGVAALELMRQCQISYKSALFLMSRIRFAMAPDPTAPKLNGTIECDETYVGGKPRPGNGEPSKRGRGTRKAPVFAVVQRGGEIRRRVVADVTAETLKSAIKEEVDSRSRIVTDEWPSYSGIGSWFDGGHHHVNHETREYVRQSPVGPIHTNTAESSFAVLKRGIRGIHHNVSKEYLHRYIWHYDFPWNNRQLNDGERISHSGEGV
jgi:transposase-like protein